MFDVRIVKLTPEYLMFKNENFSGIYGSYSYLQFLRQD